MSNKEGSGQSAIHEFLQAVEGLDWSPEGRREALSVVVQSAVNVGQTQATYYNDTRSKQKVWSTACRGGIVLFGGAGLLCPFLRPWVPLASDLGYVCLGLAAICVMTNSMFAASSNQLRFLLCQFKIEKLLADFRLSVAEAQLAWTGSTLSDKQVLDTIALTRTFISTLFDSVISETGEWGKEVRDAIDAFSRRIDGSGKQTGG